MEGGTSLSKAYGLINRFSSDVDLAVILDGLSQNQQKKLVARIGRDTTTEFEEFDMPNATVKNNRFRRTYHRYRSLILDAKKSLEFLGNHVIVEINTYGNPYPYTKRQIKPFITEMMERRGLHDMITAMDMQTFELNVLDKRRTMCEKVVSLIRFSFENDPVAGVASKIRHFYDLFYLIQDGDCLKYFDGDFATDLISLIAHDKAEFDRPPLWKSSDIRSSVLFKDLKTVWNGISQKYISEVGALSYGILPTSEEILNSAIMIFGRVKEIIER